MPILHSPGVMMPGQFGPMRRDFLAGHLRFHPHHVHHRNSFGDADDQLDAGIDRFQDSIRRARRRHENDRDVATGFLARFPDGVEDRHLAFKLLPAFPGRDASDHIGPVFHALLGMESARAAGDALHAEPSVFIDENRHSLVREKALAVSCARAACSRPDRGTAPSSRPAFPFFPCRIPHRAPSGSAMVESMSSTSKAIDVPSRDGSQPG